MSTEFEHIQPGEAVLVDWDESRYRNYSGATSRSELYMLHEHGPSRYHATVVERSMEWPSSKDMEFGTLVHMAVLEWPRFRSEVRVWPAEPTSNRPKNSDAAFESARAFGILRADSPAEQWARHDADIAALNRYREAGGIVISKDLCERVTDVAHVIKSNAYAADLLAFPGSNERTIIWREPETGILCRVRLDGLREFEGAIVVIELKTSHWLAPRIQVVEGEDGKVKLATCSWISKYGYDFQAGFYTDAVKALYPARDVVYTMIAASTERPYTAAAGPVADRLIDEGRRKYRAALKELAARRSTNNWREPWEDAYDLVFDMPDWAYPKENR